MEDGFSYHELLFLLFLLDRHMRYEHSCFNQVEFLSNKITKMLVKIKKEEELQDEMQWYCNL